MDKYMDERFERVQRALTSLIDSITKYTPSTTQAHDLAVADKELSDGLTELQTHQNNHLRIQELRKETEDLDAQIKSTVSLLWSTRKEITATPTTSYPSSGPRYDFTYSDLLNYARRISPYTMPPPGVTNGVDLSAAPPADQQASAEQTPVTATSDNPVVATTTTTNGTAATAAAPPQPPTDPSQPLPDTTQQTSFSTALPEHMSEAVNLLEGAVFHPWPGEERIRSGALDLCQRLADAGLDPKGYDPEEQERRRQAEAEEKRRREAIEDAERKRREEERFARIARERAAAAERERQMQQDAGGVGQASPSAGAAAGAAGRQEKKQFQFMGGLDDDEDED